ncbi:MAG: hypothetical protein ACR2GS_11930 [Thermomicrobiales bacterium]
MSVWRIVRSEARWSGIWGEVQRTPLGWKRQQETGFIEFLPMIAQ